MGILNVTPDSFSDGGRFNDRDAALRQAERLAAEGAAIIDIGGESTRPGAKAVSVQQELDRVMPLIERLHDELSLPLSIDTSKPEVMRAAVAAGAGLINDVYALRREGALQAAAELAVPVCLMHMQGEPRLMQHNPSYADVVAEVADFFAERIGACEQAGIRRDRLLLDPGFGFGKTLQHNLQLLARLARFNALGLPLLVGISRKSMIGALLDKAPVDQRLYGSLAAAVLAAERGASILRVHDVKATVDALKVVAAMAEWVPERALGQGVTEQ
ncbi:dihydropteroate synthase [Magnetovirga frankeli]|uniref:dihydropteroate synthase n=1 Tax=Magnetovirga frankeli TaxID=947516 RepID=UPI001293DDBB|nr:dihydropteroate synthase [gamma proteobacterium SS-5]